jgi:hypothetical protein
MQSSLSKWTWAVHSLHQIQLEKTTSPPTPNHPQPPNLKGKKPRHPESMIEPTHWLDEIPLPKRVRHNFSPGLIPLANNTPVRRGGFWAKHMGLKSNAIWNTLGEHIENLGNKLGTW